MHKSMLRRGVHHCRRLQSAWIKYGADAFRFEVVATTAEDQLFALETSHIAGARNDRGVYNTAPVGGTTAGVKLGPMSLEVRAKLSAAQKGRRQPDHVRAAVGAAHRGQTLSEKQLSALRLANTGRKPSAETRAKLSLASAAITDETRAKRAASMRATITPERRAAMVKAASSISDETRRKRSESVRLSWELRRA